MVITSYGAQAQNNLIDMDVQSTPTIEEVQMSEEVIDTIPQRRVGPPHFGHPLPPNVRQHGPMMMVPKPESIIRKGDKVILIFDKNDFDKFRKWHLLRNRRKHVTEIGWQKRVENNSMPKDYLEKNHKFHK